MMLTNHNSIERRVNLSPGNPSPLFNSHHQTQRDLIMARKGNHDEVCHAWAHNLAIDVDSPRNSEPYESSSMSRDGSGDLYSYGTVIGVRVSTDLFLVASEQYSITTASKHKPAMHRSIPHSAIVFTVPNPSAGHYRTVRQSRKGYGRTLHDYNLDHYHDMIQEAAEKASPRS